MSLQRDQLQDRFQKLQAKRADVAAQRQAELLRLDDQIAALRTLAQTWDTITLDQAFVLLQQAGIRPEFQS